MAASRFTQLEDRMSCVVCLEKFDSSHVPKLLPCHHTFCEVCIRKSTRQNSKPPSLDCPICRYKHVIPQGGFLTNRALLDVVEEFMKAKQIALKCKKHSNKEVVIVCIDCLDVLCNTCVKSHIHLHGKHQLQEVDEATPALQRKFKESQRSHELCHMLMIEESHCSSTEMAKVAKDITSFAHKLHAEINKWEKEQLAMVQEMSSFLEAQEREIRSKLDTLNDDIETLIFKIQETDYLGKEVDEAFNNKLQQRKTALQNRFDHSFKTLLDKMRAEIETKTAIQSSFLKSQQGIQSKIPKEVKVLYKIHATSSSANVFDFDDPILMKAGDVIAVTEEFEDVSGEMILNGINISTGQEGLFDAEFVKKIQ